MPLPPNSKYRYEFDPTGVNPDNLVANEGHTTTNRKRKIIVPLHSAFYGESLRITDIASGRVLDYKTDYILDDSSEIVAMKTGKEAYHAIIITATDVGIEYSISYQTVGGIYSIDKLDVIYQALEDANLDNRPVEWENISNKPNEYNPAEHLHKLEDVYGFEHLAYVIERLVNARLVGDEASHDSIWDAINSIDFDAFRAEINDLINEVINVHINNKDNPHQVTAEQVNTYTKEKIDQLINAVKNDLTNHINNTNNPHNVTSEQVDTYNKAKITELINAAKTALTNSLNAHINNKNNPHNVTRTQLDVYSKSEVDNLINTAKTQITTAYNNAITQAVNTINTTIAKFYSTSNNKLVAATVPIGSGLKVSNGVIVTDIKNDPFIIDNGYVEAFNYTDVDGTVYPGCRFKQTKNGTTTTYVLWPTLMVN